ncbi:hypothetical protein PAPYR_2854 [Paratrimastix pyriformis]|uniref:Protein kinase domain-containing protein n=1 Tax=Paratrimastix pyriformis TaxID=342808 RepID=A0ABQ8UP79_9EUKA|nr:hypothetical protein PAPYR_2854 [Paratrimastix pyriformis]
MSEGVIAYRVTERFLGTQPGDLPFANSGDIIIVSGLYFPAPDSKRLLFLGNDPLARPFACNLKTLAEGCIPRKLLQRVPEGQSASYLDEFQAHNHPGFFTARGQDLTDRIERGERPTLYALLSNYTYQHKPSDPLPPPLLPQHVALAPDARPVTQTYYVLDTDYFGATFRCEVVAHPEQVVAIKATKYQQSATERNLFYNQIFVTSRVDHPNVIRAAGPPFEDQVCSTPG